MRRRKTAKITERHRAVARDYVKGGKSLERAMADHGFSAAYGRQGVQNVARASRLFREAFNQELEGAMQLAEGADLAPEKLGKLATWRLAVNLARGKDEASHSAKLVGSMKAVDLFVRSGGEVHGLFAWCIDPKDGELFDQLTAVLPKDESKDVQ